MSEFVEYWRPKKFQSPSSFLSTSSPCIYPILKQVRQDEARRYVRSWRSCCFIKLTPDVWSSNEVSHGPVQIVHCGACRVWLLSLPNSNKALLHAFNRPLINSALEESLIFSGSFVAACIWKTKLGSSSSAKNNWMAVKARLPDGIEFSTIWISCATLSKLTEFRLFQYRVSRSDNSISRCFWESSVSGPLLKMVFMTFCCHMASRPLCSRRARMHFLNNFKRAGKKVAEARLSRLQRLDLLTISSSQLKLLKLSKNWT